MDSQTMYDTCRAALVEYVKDAGFDEVLIGLSGGIDSALTATLCVDAFGASRVHGVLLPGPYSSTHSVDDARTLVKNLGIEAETISIVGPYEAFKRAIQDSSEWSIDGIAAENTQARCRMVCLMALSNQYGWLLINTGNKSEAMMGYSTLYGDTAGAFAPLGGLYKTDVYALARCRNEKGSKDGGVAPIPQHTLEKPPSAELSPGQEDEHAMGISYDALDRILIALVEKGKAPEDIMEEGFSAEDIVQIRNRIDAFAFKRALEPPFPSASFYDC